jgi:hypothetical protein
MSALESLKREARDRIEELQAEIDLYESAESVVAETEAKVRAALEEEYAVPAWVSDLIKEAVRARETGDVSRLPRRIDALADYGEYCPEIWA